MKKTVLKVCINCLKCKTNILKAVAKLSGINELAVDDEKGTLTVIGDVDPVCVANRLKKMGKLIEIISIGPAKPPDKPKPPEKGKTDPKPPLPSCCDKCQFTMIIYDDVRPWINELAVDDHKGTLTVIGDVDPVCVANRLKKMGKLIEIISIGPAKPPDKPKPPEKGKTDPKPPLPSCCDKCQFAMIIYDDVIPLWIMLELLWEFPSGEVDFGALEWKLPAKAMEKNLTSDAEISRCEVFLRAHIRKDKVVQYPDLAEKLDELYSSNPASRITSMDDALTELVGSDKRGRMRSVGCSISKIGLKKSAPAHSKVENMTKEKESVTPRVISDEEKNG
ncbi:uncharacterized protein LOC131231731 [Magnolia sinica]|uniref:uncharacterized protein LOC131231731 n=1 Tax=Magnolia sinica TaxID=86752 RepID=UPI002659F998|nr:uncharacterized protein LOC131231731 [Magnolia sinica]